MRRYLKKIKNKLFYILVEQNKTVLKKYQEYRLKNEDRHNRFRFLTWCYIIWWNFLYRILRLKAIDPIKPTSNNNKKNQKNKVLENLNDAESLVNPRQKPEYFAKKLLGYDIISFDIFDTLIFRPLQSPNDLFIMLSEKHSYMGFQDIRIHQEKLLREEAQQRQGNREITFREIYERVSQYTGIDIEYGMKLEYELEEKLCFANPYMKKVFEILKNNNKRIIAVSDMYLPKSLIEKLLANCGYEGFSEIFVSSEYKRSKGYYGELYKVVDEVLEREGTIVHVGDNYHSDIKMAEKQGWDTSYYRGVGVIGNKYRAPRMSPLIKSAYAGIVNTHLHNGVTAYNKHYEFGFVYGGLFVLGYCRFIHEYAKNNNIDKILFLSRDGDVLKRVYDKLYPNDNTEYVFWSRMASLVLSSSKYRHDYLFQYITMRAARGYNYSAKELLRIMNLEHLLSKLTGKKLTSETIINKNNMHELNKFLLENWDSVQEQNNKMLEPARIYFDKIIKDCRKVCAVDIGWRGSGAMGLKALIEEIWEYDCTVTGLIGASYKSGEKSNISLIMNNTIVPYMFSQVHNVDKYNFHNSGSDHCIITELFLSAKHPSFKGFKKKGEADFDLIFDMPEIENYEAIDNIQKGIESFVNIYYDKFGETDYMLNISGNDAYSPIMHILENKEYLKILLGDYVFNRDVGSNATKSEFRRIENIIEQ